MKSQEQQEALAEAVELPGPKDDHERELLKRRVRDAVVVEVWRFPNRKIIRVPHDDNLPVNCHMWRFNQKVEGDMAKYLLEARYTIEGTKGLAREGGTGRREAVKKMIEGLGGKLETFYYAFGEVDVYVIVDMPDSIAVAAAALAVSQGGGATIRTVVLIPPEDVDKAGKKAVDYRPPGH